LAICLPFWSKIKDLFLPDKIVPILEIFTPRDLLNLFMILALFGLAVNKI
jgi:hypothetical protein